MLLITDLDNTLYDWVTYFATAFGAMVDETLDVVPVGREHLLGEFKAVHQTYGDSEVPFALLELPSVQAHFRTSDRVRLREQLAAPLAAFNRVREATLKLYPGVLETLEELSRAGWKIVGYTEASWINAARRLGALSLLPYFSHVYVSAHRYQPHPNPEKQSEMPPNFISVAPQDRKPNPHILIEVCREEDVSPSDAWYVGDSRTRDVPMAKAAGVVAVWARYGCGYDRALWQTLVRVTHWTERDLAVEQERAAMPSVKPDYIIDRFDELLDVTCVRRAAAHRTAGSATGG
jgi:FMN phosphatase YigB (HAD superfamily)